MEFFNRKEEVIDIQLTQRGKYLLSKGRLNPKYYAFYDDDLIYDSSYAGFGEHPAEAEGRMTTTPRIKSQYAFEGAETRIAKIKQSEQYQELPNDEKLAALEPALLTSTNITGLSAHLGTSAFNSHKSPAWNISMLSGYMEEAHHYTSNKASITLEFSGTPAVDQEIKLISSHPRPDDDRTVTYVAKGTANLASNQFSQGAGSIEILINSLKEAIEHTNGHGTRFVVTKPTDTSLKITQSRSGPAGDTPITYDLANVTDDGGAAGIAAGSNTMFTGGGSIRSEKIPQIDVKSTTRVSVLTSEESGDNSYEFGSEEGNTLQLADIFEDGSSFQVLGDTIIFDIEEFHATKREFNFDVEIFEIETDENNNEELRPLRFASQGDNMISNLSYEVDGDIVSNLVGESAENTNYADYYIEISTDEQVQLPVLGTPATSLDTPEDAIPTNDFDCPDDEEN